MDNKFRSLMKDTFIFAVGSVGSKLILFLLVPLYTNYLSTSEYGVADLVFTVSQVLIPIFSIVIYNAVLRFGLSSTTQKEDFLLCAILVFLIGTVLLFALTPLLGLYRAISEWKWYLYVYVCLYSLNTIELSYLKANGKNKIYTLLSLIQTLVLAVTNIVLLVWVKAGVNGYLLSNITACSLSCIVAFVLGHVRTALKSARLNVALLKSMVAFSAPGILNDISWWVIHSSDKVMIEYMVTDSALGVYTVATKIPSLINVLINIFSQAWGISSVREIESTDDVSFYGQVFSAYSTLTYGAAVVLLAVIKPFMYVYVGSDFFSAWKMVPLLLISACFSAISAYCGALYGAIKRTINSMWTTVIAAVLNVFLNYICIHKLGAMGAVIGTVISFLVVANIRLLDVRRYIEFNVDWKRYILSACLLMCQGILITLNWHIYIVSVGVIIAFFVINRRMSIFLVTKLCDVLKEQRLRRGKRKDC